MAETSRYPLIQESLALMEQQIDKAFLYERIMTEKYLLGFNQEKRRKGRWSSCAVI